MKFIHNGVNDALPNCTDLERLPFVLNSRDGPASQTKSSFELSTHLTRGVMPGVAFSCGTPHELGPPGETSTPGMTPPYLPKSINWLLRGWQPHGLKILECLHWEENKLVQTTPFGPQMKWCESDETPSRGVPLPCHVRDRWHSLRVPLEEDPLKEPYISLCQQEMQKEQHWKLIFLTPRIFSHRKIVILGVLWGEGGDDRPCWSTNKRSSSTRVELSIWGSGSGIRCQCFLFWICSNFPVGNRNTDLINRYIFFSRCHRKCQFLSNLSYYLSLSLSLSHASLHEGPFFSCNIGYKSLPSSETHPSFRNGRHRCNYAGKTTPRKIFCASWWR